MSEDNLAPGPEVPTQPPTEASAGMLLRSAREAAGLHVAALAVSMKVPVKKLEALEADRFDLLPDAVFVRALASSVCRNLKIDSAPVLSRLPNQDVPRLSATERGINAPFHAAGEKRAVSVPAMLKQPVFLVVLLLLVAALVVSFFPGWPGEETPAEDVAVVAEPDPLMPPQQSVPLDTQTPPPTASESVVPAVQQPVAAVPVSAPTAVAPAIVASVPLAIVALPAVKAASAPVQPLGGQQVVFRVRGSSWVEVTDVKGVVLMRRNLLDGDSVGVSGALPLSVVVGRADVTEVEIKGKAFSLAGIAKDNVARFEVK